MALVVGVLTRAELPYMVIGGLANLVWGEPRTTTDIDITVDVHEFGLTQFSKLVAEIGEPLPENPIAFAERTRVMPVRTHQGVIVDFVLATLPFERDAIERATIHEIESVEIKVCTPEDLILHKIVSTRARDHEDIVGVLKRQGDRLDMVRLDQVIQGFAEDLAEPEIAERFQQAKRAAGRHR